MKKSIVLSSVFLSIVLFFGCSHQGEGKLPKVKTGNVYFTSPRAFMAGALVEANGTGVLKYGICYSATNHKPDINDECMDVTYEATDWGFRPLGGSDHQAFISGNMYEAFTAATVYVRAYAMTSDGQYVYGKTVSCSRDDENTPWGMLKRPVNGWILQSYSIQHGIPDMAHIGDYYPDGVEVGLQGDMVFWSYGDGCSGLLIGVLDNKLSVENSRLTWNFEEFIRGSSEFLPDPTILDVNADPLSGWGYYDILNFTRNELKIRGNYPVRLLEGYNNFIDTLWIDYVYVPAP